MFSAISTTLRTVLFPTLTLKILTKTWTRPTSIGGTFIGRVKRRRTASSMVSACIVVAPECPEPKAWNNTYASSPLTSPTTT